jgi:hypothetical protein
MVTAEPAAAAGDDHTHIVIKPSQGAKGASTHPACNPVPVTDVDDDDLDITMGLVGGRLPTGFNPADIDSAETVSGTLTRQSAKEHLSGISEGAQKLIKLVSKNNG